MKKRQGGKRPGAGRPAHRLGAGIRADVMIPKQLHAAIRAEADEAGCSFSAAIIARLIRGKKRGATL